MLRVKQNTPAYNTGVERAVISTEPKYKFNNNSFSHQICNLTIHIEDNNPDAVGIIYRSANGGDVRNVLVRSQDASSRAGIVTSVGSVHGVLSDITVDGFQHGIETREGLDVSICVEHLTLKNQKSVPFWVKEGMVTLRNLYSVNSISNTPALLLSGSTSAVSLLDSSLNGTAEAAIQINGGGQLFARNVNTSGYAKAAKEGSNAVVASKNITEYHTGQVLSLFGNPAFTRNLPIEDEPVVPWETSLSQWANLDDYGPRNADGTHSQTQVQGAMDSGKSTIHFPSKAYDTVNEKYVVTATRGTLEQTVTRVSKRTIAANIQVNVPASVERIYGYHNNFGGMKIQVVEASNEPLVIEGARFISLRMYAHRPVIIRNTNVGFLNVNIPGATGQPLRIFASPGLVLTGDPNPSQYPLDYYARFQNQEASNASVNIGGNTKAVILMDKTEYAGSDNGNHYNVTNRGEAEVFGLYNAVGQFRVLSHDSYLAVSMMRPRNNSDPDEIVEISNGVTRTYDPVSNSQIIPLYLTGSALPENVKIVQKNSNLELALADDTQNNANANAESSSTEDDHLWEKLDAGSGWFRLRNKKSGKFLNVSGASLDDRANIAQWSSSSSDHFTFREVADNGYIALQIKHSMMYVGTIGTSNETNVQQTATIFDRSRWTVSLSGAYVKYVQKNSGLELALASDTQNNGNANAESNSTELDHRWVIEPSGDSSWFYLKNKKSGYYLNVSGSNQDDDANIAQWVGYNGDHFKFRSVPSNGYSILQIKHSMKYVDTISSSSGTNVKQNDSVSDSALWNLIHQ